MSNLVHIASFIVQHRPQGALALDAAIAERAEFELAARDGARSVLLCESADERELIDQIDALRQLDGILGITLVHHHAESAQSLSEEIEDGHTP